MSMTADIRVVHLNQGIVKLNKTSLIHIVKLTMNLQIVNLQSCPSSNYKKEHTKQNDRASNIYYTFID